MKYDFTTILDRKNKESRSYDSIGKIGNPSVPNKDFDTIPMFVSDMDFIIAPSIQKELEERLKHPIFGYFDTPEWLYESIVNWHVKTKNMTNLKNEHIGYQNDVLGGLVSALRALNKPGDSILLHAPTFVGFVNIINSLGYKSVLSELIPDENGIYRMNYSDMDKKIKENNIKTVILCSPHNPLGRMWDESELKLASEVFEKNSCTIISDEIWSEIELNGKKHYPTQNATTYLKNNTIALYSPNKGFNIAGLNISYHIIYNDDLRKKVETSSNLTYYNSPNILSMYALKGAYTQDGLEWLKEMQEVISKNINYTYDFINDNFKDINVIKPEGTYILFLDCEKWIKNNNITMDELLEKGYKYGIGWSDGRPFNAKYGIRLNLGIHFEKVQEMLYRLKKYIFIG